MVGAYDSHAVAKNSHVVGSGGVPADVPFVGAEVAAEASPCTLSIVA